MHYSVYQSLDVHTSCTAISPVARAEQAPQRWHWVRDCCIAWLMNHCMAHEPQRFHLFCLHSTLLSGASGLGKALVAQVRCCLSRPDAHEQEELVAVATRHAHLFCLQSTLLSISSGLGKALGARALCRQCDVAWHLHLAAVSIAV